jgi:hypothetical protein
LFGLLIIVTLATFQQLGKEERDEQVFLMNNSRTKIWLEMALKKTVKMPSAHRADVVMQALTLQLEQCFVSFVKNKIRYQNIR